MAQFHKYVLSRTLANHSNDVRAVAFIDDDKVVTTSRDGKAVLTAADGHTTTLVEGQAFLNSVVADNAAHKIYIGSHDSTIICHDLTSGAQTFFLGHSANVSCLDVLPETGQLASGSWDHTVRVWSSPSASVELEGHTQNVWDVKFVDANRLLTASADRTIRLWDIDTRQEVRRYTGHGDVVRALLVLPDSQFLSASNDGTLILWGLDDGAQKAVLRGHTSFVYSLARASSDYVVSGGEDRTARVWDWKTQRCVQTIVLPAISQWSVASIGSGDFAVGSSDNRCRVFTQKEARFAPAEELAAFDELVKSTASSETEVDESQIADASVLERPGDQEGQVAIVRNAQTKALEAHQFSGGAWAKLGDVVGRSQSSGSKRETLNGQQYDYVFDVDVEDGKPPLRLPYNNGENPYSVAEKFIADNQLPPSYVEQVAKFIIQNSEVKSFDATTAAPAAATPTQTQTSTQAPVPASDTPAVLQYSQPLMLKAFQGPQLLNALQKVADEQGDNLSQYQLEPLLNALPSSASELLKVALELKGKYRTNLAHLLPVLDLLRIALADAPTISYQVAWINVLDAIDADLPKHSLLATRGVVNLLARPDFDAASSINRTMVAQAVVMVQTMAARLDAVAKPLAVALATLALNLAIVQPAGVDLASFLQVVAAKVRGGGDAEAFYRLALAAGLHSVAAPADAPRLKRSWLADPPAGDARVQELLAVVLPRLAN